MQKTMTPRLIPALIALVFSGTASAAGFQLLEQNASGLGNAYAGSAAVAENASTIFFNPAGMTQLQARELSVGGTLVKTNFEFNNNGSSTGLLTGDGGNGGSLGFIPNAYMSWALNRDWYVGLGIGAPFGLKTEYDNPWRGGAHSLSFDIKTINLNPSIAWRATEWMSLGLGVNIQKIDAKYEKLAGIGPVNIGPPLGVRNLHQATTTLDADDTAWGWNAGALFTLSPSTKLGISYRSSVKYTLEGSLTTTGPDPVLNGATSSGAKADLKLPDTFVVSLTHALNERWELLGDISWTGWSSIDKVDIIRTSGPLTGATALRLDTQFKDTWRVALGANYQLNEAVKLKFGIAYDQTPIKDAEHRLTSLPDNDRTWFSAGVQWKPSKTSVLDVGGAYLYVRDAAINNAGTSPVQGLVKGSYDDSAWILGAQYSMAF